MNEHDLSILLLQLGVMLAVALVGGAVAHRLGLLVVLGELVGGIVLGPTVLSHVAPGAYSILFPNISAISTTREGLLKLGIVLFLFVAGMEISLDSLHRRRSAIFGASVGGIAVPFALGAGSVLLLPTLWGAQAQGSFPFPLLIGTMLALTSLPVIARILVDLNLAKEELGTIVMSGAAINDLVGWSLFAALLSTAAIPGVPDRNLLMTLLAVVVLVGLIFGPGRWLARRALRFIGENLSQPGSSIAAALIAVLLVAALSEAVGLHAFLGAFLAGVALSGHTQEKEHAWSTIRQFAFSFFAPLYFVSVGLRTDFIANFDSVLVLVVLVVACLGKIIGVSIGAWLGKLPANEALAVGFGMNARGSMEMIVAALALDYGLIDARIFVALVVMALVTSLMSGPAMQWLLSRQAQLMVNRSEEGALKEKLDPQYIPDHA
jgi:Kef-type K+ transport system membrane component KefB